MISKIKMLQEDDMLYREINTVLRNWAKDDNGKCLMIRGPRQVGKTFSAVQLGKEMFDSFIEINFLKSPSLKSIFSGDLDTATLVRNISLSIPGSSFLPGTTLLLLDEIQECPEAITSLKFWADDRKYKVIATGSMLGIDYKRPTSYPVGYIQYVDMLALNFREFLLAMDVSEDVISFLRDCFTNVKPVPEAVHNKILEYLRLYLAIGGMPDVVQTYSDTGDIVAADKKQRSILEDYKYDIAHYAAPDVKIKAENCYLSIPAQLSKDNHKFKYSIVEKGGNARKYSSSLDWLSAADMIRFSYNTKNMKMPLENYKEADNFRIYTTDIGMLTSMYDFSIKSRLIQNLPDESKGGLYEALAADMLIKNGHKTLYFRKNEQATFELEFLMPSEDGVIPVEVKAGNSRSRSLDNALEKTDIPYGYKLTSGNAGKSGKKITMPLYMAMFI